MPESSVLAILAFLVGLTSGFAAVLLKKFIELIEYALTSRLDSPQYSLLYLLYPGVGMLLSLIFVRYILKDDIGHGVTKILKSVSRNESNIRSHNMWSSILTSSVTIGFGGSVGAEAPIVYSGAAIGSNIARAFNLPYKQVTILLGCGAAGAIAGIFKAPLAGVLFTLEILLFNISMTSLLPILISSITATVVSYFCLGDAVQFSNTLEKFSMGNLPFYVVLGIFCGFISLYFINTTIHVEDMMRKISGPFVRWIIGALSLGVMIFLFRPLYGEGYDTLTDLLTNNHDGVSYGIFGGKFLSTEWAVVIFFAAIMLLKVLATAFTNSGGGVGGTFGPTLFTGGIAGFVVARIINISGIHMVPEANFVLVGMAGMMAGVMQAPMTAIFLIAEITGGYELLIPLILTAVVSFATIRVFEPYSIYTKRLAAEGALLTHDSDKAVLTLLKTTDLIEKDFTAVDVNGYLGDLVKVISRTHRNIFPVVDSEGHFQGGVLLDDVREIMFDADKYDRVKISSIMRSAPAFIYDDEPMESVMKKFEYTHVWNLPVVDVENRYLGFVSKSKIFNSYREQLQQVSHD